MFRGISTRLEGEKKKKLGDKISTPSSLGVYVSWYF